jgi:hypothetical protein
MSGFYNKWRCPFPCHVTSLFGWRQSLKSRIVLEMGFSMKFLGELEDLSLQPTWNLFVPYMRAALDSGVTHPSAWQKLEWIASTSAPPGQAPYPYSLSVFFLKLLGSFPEKTIGLWEQRHGEADLAGSCWGVWLFRAVRLSLSPLEVLSVCVSREARAQSSECPYWDGSV